MRPFARLLTSGLALGSVVDSRTSAPEAEAVVPAPALAPGGAGEQEDGRSLAVTFVDAVKKAVGANGLAPSFAETDRLKKAFMKPTVSLAAGDVHLLDLNTKVNDLDGGFADGFTDGTYGYLVPATSAQLLRFDLATFSDVKVLEVDTVDSDLFQFGSGFVDSQNKYGFITCSGQYCGKVVRFDLKTFGNVEELVLTKKDPDLKGFSEGFSDGKYGYLVPYYTGESTFGKVARFDLESFSVDDVKTLNLETTDKDLKGFSGGFQDGTYGYLVPFQTGTPGSDDDKFDGKVARFKLETFGDVEELDVHETDPALMGFARGFEDGIYGYLVPFYAGITEGKVARFDLATFKKVEVLDLTKTDPDLKGFVGGFAQDGWGYLMPYQDGSGTPDDEEGDVEMRLFGKIACINLDNFKDVQVIDLNKTDRELVGFQGGFIANGFGYAVPNGYSKVARWELLAPTGPAQAPEGGGWGSVLVVFLILFALVAVAGGAYYAYTNGLFAGTGGDGAPSGSGARGAEMTATARS
jgi:hypothetical protein